MQKIVVILLFSMSFICPVWAQFDSQISNYWANRSSYNPAYAGQSGKLEATLMSRMQWVGIKNAPQTTFITAEMPYHLLGRTHGFGISVYNDKIGLFSSSVMSGQYAWQKKIKKGLFSVGIQGGYIQQKFDGTKVEIPESESHTKPDQDEAIPTTEVSGSAIDAALGVYYSHPNWYAGASVTHLLGSELELGDNYVVDIPRSYYLTAGYNIKLNNPLIELQPSILIKTMEVKSLYVEPDSIDESIVVEEVEENLAKALLRNTQLDVTLRMVYNKKFMGGLTWRKGDALILSLGAKLSRFEIGYAYDFPISRIVKESTGSHELYAKVIVDIGQKKGDRNKHKSVRYL